MTETDRVRGSSTLVGVMLGRYLIERLLGEGGMGAVYAARHQDLGKSAAVKVLHERYDESEEVRGRFLREGQTASRIRHPNIVDVYDVGTEQGRAYLVMELLDGESLAGLLARERPLSVQRIADLLVPVTSALAAAHELGIVHRDLKPDNIFLSSERSSITPKVLDFGISKLSSPDEAAAPLTGTGTLLGTPQYMSPEQAQTDKSIDGRSDQYSFGVILYECATGRVPIQGALYQLLPRIVQGDFPAPRQFNQSISAAFEQLILRAMARDPAERFANMRALGRALLGFASERVRANHAEELALDASPALPPQPPGPRHVSELKTTLGESIHERDGVHKPTASRSLILRRAGGVLAAVVVLGAVWQLSSSIGPARSSGLATSSLATTTPAPASTAAGEIAPIASRLPPSPAPATARQAKRLTSEPSGANVWVAGKNVGRTPLLVEVTADTPIAVELRSPGFRLERRQITLFDPETVAIQLIETPRAKPAAAKRAPPVDDRPKLAPR
jgi:serine/threonine protein kinase